MIDDKYHIVAEIEHESQIVFETSDIESDEEYTTRNKESADDNKNDIIQDTFDMQRAKDRFSNDIIVGDIDLMNFSGAISSNSLASSGFKVKKVKETVDQKLARINRELEEIRLEQEKEDGHKVSDEINMLTTLLEAVQLKKNSHQKLNPHENHINSLFEKVTQDVGQPLGQEQKLFDVQDVNIAQVLELDSKINHLENLIGIGPSQKSQFKNPDLVESNSNLINVIRDLKRKANIVNNPEYNLQIIKEEIEFVREQTEKLISDRRLLHITQPNDTVVLESESPASNKIDDLYLRLPEFENANAKIPMIINRLKSLHTVHSDLARSIDVIKSLDSVLYNMSQDVSSWNDAVDNVSVKIDAYSSNFESKKDEVSKLVSDVYTKVESICTR